MSMIRPRKHAEDQRGAIAILVAVLSLALFMIAALAVDITTQVNKKDLLQNQLDASATAAAYNLDLTSGSLNRAVTAAATYWANNGNTGAFDYSKVDFWCVVARSSVSPNNDPYSDDYQIPGAAASYVGSGVCNPDANGETLATTPKANFHQNMHQNMTRLWDGHTFSMNCNATLCAIPCGLQASPSNQWNPGTSTYNLKAITCNTIRIGAKQGVPFAFASAGGIPNGSTGSVVSVACRGACGTVAPNPMNIMIMADRTNSMVNGVQSGGAWQSVVYDYRQDLVSGILSMLGVMTPSQQFVSLGALGPSSRSSAPSDCATYPDNPGKVGNSAWTYATGYEYGDGVGLSGDSNSTKGTWTPLSFYNDYASGGVPNTSSPLVQAVNCLATYNGKTIFNGTNTALASPLKAATRYVLGYDSSNLSTLAANSSRTGDVKNVIIFETDGQPNETPATTGTTSINTKGDVFSNRDTAGCEAGQVEDDDECYTNSAAPSCSGSQVLSSGKCYTSTGSPACAATYTLSGSNPGTCYAAGSATKCSNSSYPTFNSDDGVCYVRQAGVTSCSNGYTAVSSTCYKTSATTNGTCSDPTTGLTSGGKCYSNASCSLSGYNPTPVSSTNYACWKKGSTATCTSGSLVAVNGAYGCYTSKGTPATCSVGSSATTIGGSYSCWSSVSACPAGTSYDTHSSTSSCWTDQGGVEYTGGQTACSNFLKVAAQAKAAGILLIVIGYNLAGKTCADENGLGTGSAEQANLANSPNNQSVISVLAQAASGSAGGTTSADTTSTASCDPDENSDGDYFFCAAQGSDLASIFKTAISQASGSVRLLSPSQFG
jgi:hypothetical protein